MSHKKYADAYTLIYSPGEHIPVFVKGRNLKDTGQDSSADTGAAHDWINANKAAYGAASKWFLGDTGWSDTGYPQVQNKGTVLEVWYRYDTGDTEDWDKTSWRVTQ